MLQSIFGTPANFALLMLSLLFRSARAIHDGLSDRGTFYYSANYASNLYGKVGAWPWHLANWFGRDLFIFLLYLYLYASGTPLLTLIAAVLVNYLLHDFFYYLVASRRKNFRWGAEFDFKFPSFFRRVFKPWK